MSESCSSEVSQAELASRVRSLVDTVRVADATDAVRAEAAALVSQAEALLADRRWPGPYAQGALNGGLARTEQWSSVPAEIFPYSPVIGPANPVSPNCMMRKVGAEVHGEATLSPTFCGAPGLAHGGVIALIFDELLGLVSVLNDVGAMTGTLTITYRRPTPIQRELRLRGWLDHVDGRKVYVKGEMGYGDVTTAEAEGVFIRTNVAPLPDS